MNHGVIPQNLDQQIQVKQPQLQQNPLPPNAHFHAIQSQNSCQQEQETSVNTNQQQPQTIQPQPQNISASNNLCTSVQDQTCATSATSHKTKKVIEKSRRERKTIARQSSAPNTNTTMQQLAVNTQSPVVRNIFNYIINSSYFFSVSFFIMEILFVFAHSRIKPLTLIPKLIQITIQL